MADDTARRAIERPLAVGQALPTPSGGVSFSITAMNGEGIRINRQVPCITWMALEQVVSVVRNQGSPVRIGAVHGIPEPGTLEAYLMDALDTKTSTASYAAAILTEAGIAEYAKVAGSRAMHIRPLPPFTANMPPAVPPTPTSDGD